MTTIDDGLTVGASSATLAPVAPKNRIATLDVMRGVAVLGILAVNIPAFAYPSSVYFSPELGPFPLIGGAAVAEWVVDVFFHQKFITLFSMLFGASIFLVGGERRDKPRGKLIRNRLWWLVVIALIHGLLLWWGDVLLLYACTGLVVMFMRSWRARTLIIVGSVITFLFFLLQGGSLLALLVAPPEVVAKVAASAGGQSGGDTAATVAASIAAYKSGWAGMLAENLKPWIFLQRVSLMFISVPTAGLMLLGMGLLKSGFWAGRSATWIYALLIIIGGAVLALLGWVDWRMIGEEDKFSRLGLVAGAVGAAPVLITLGYASLLILLTTRGLSALTAPFAPVGRMAFTNYLTQSLLMTTLFTQPWGPHWIGTLDRPALWIVVVCVWALQLVWSPLWLSRFSHGPLEWVWRCLTYGRRVPISKAG